MPSAKGEVTVSLSSGKNQLRKLYTSRRNAMCETELADCSVRICENIRSLDIYRNSECVAGFFALGAEPDISSLFPEKRFFLPRYNGGTKAYEMVEMRDIEHDLVVGRYNIPEPRQELEAADAAWCGENLLYLVPAVACDLRGVRLGRGGGFYDRLLSDVKLPVVGVIFSCQLADALPSEEHDVRLDMVVTEEKSVVCKP